ncbi:MAG: heparinase, partial [Burkholderiales bacterium]|nr:heparinase [Opitutaceae bacterium]
MSLFLTSSERARLLAPSAGSPSAALLAAMQARVLRRAASPGFTDREATTDWWHHAAEYLTDAALIHAVRPSPRASAWLHSAVLGIIRRPLADWAGPPFRGFGGGALFGSLETAHLAWGIAVAFDLAADLFSADEHAEIVAVLRERGIAACRRYLDHSGFCHNWNCVLLAGFTVCAAVLDDADSLAAARDWFPLAADHFQPDGSYGESLQYGNYAAFSLVLAREALVRRAPAHAAPPTLDPYVRFVEWAAQSFLHRKPLSGWGPTERPRSANFGDSGALFRPSGDLLIHLAVHARESHPREAGLARWLFDTLYFPAAEPGPHDLASFGFLPGFGFLSVILLAEAPAPLAPSTAGLPLVATFSGGDAFARDTWENTLTTLAVRTPAAPRHATAHIHGDV